MIKNNLELESTAEELGKTIHAHPTVSESVMEAAEGVHNLTIHLNVNSESLRLKSNFI